MGWNRGGSDGTGMGRDEMRCNEVGWDGMGWNGDGMGWGWDSMGQHGMTDSKHALLAPPLNYGSANLCHRTNRCCCPHSLDQPAAGSGEAAGSGAEGLADRGVFGSGFPRWDPVWDQVRAGSGATATRRAWVEATRETRHGTHATRPDAATPPPAPRRPRRAPHPARARSRDPTPQRDPVLPGSQPLSDPNPLSDPLHLDLSPPTPADPTTASRARPRLRLGIAAWRVAASPQPADGIAPHIPHHSHPPLPHSLSTLAPPRAPTHRRDPHAAQPVARVERRGGGGGRAGAWG